MASLNDSEFEEGKFPVGLKSRYIRKVDRDYWQKKAKYGRDIFPDCVEMIFVFRWYKLESLHEMN